MRKTIAINNLLGIILVLVGGIIIFGGKRGLVMA
jgi:hypothetical protein